MEVKEMENKLLTTRKNLLKSWGFENKEESIFELVNENVEIKFDLGQETGAYVVDGELGIVYDFYHLSQIIGELTC